MNERDEPMPALDVTTEEGHNKAGDLFWLLVIGLFVLFAMAAFGGA